MGALTDTGFNRPLYEEIVQALEARAKDLMGEDMDTSEASVLGKFIRIPARALADAYEDMERAYYARFPHYAVGSDLDKLLVYAGISRNPAVTASYTAEIRGTPGADLEAGYLVQTEGAITFRTQDDYIIPETGLLEAAVYCTEAGVIGNVPLHTITIPVNPDGRVTAVDNVAQLTTGRPAESDYEVRQRFDAAIYGVGGASLEAVRAAILRVPGVVAATIEENDTDAAVGGLPPHSFRPSVLSDGTAAEQEIGNAIFEKKAVGIKSYGDVSVEVSDGSGGVHTIGFSWVTSVSIYVTGTVAVDSSFPDPVGASPSAAVAAAVADWVSRFAAGQDVVFAALYPVLYGIPGVKDVKNLRMKAGDGGTWGTNNIVIAGNQAARVLSTDNITVGSEVYADQ